MSGPSINFHAQTKAAQFRIPTELIKRNFKNIQKLVEKQRRSVSDEIAKIKSLPLSAETKLDLVTKQIKQFESFQSKLKAYVALDEDYRDRISARLENLTQLEEYVIPSDSKQPDGKTDNTDRHLDTHNPNLINWYRDQANLLMVDYLIKSSTAKENTGLKLLESLAASKPELPKLIDHDLYASFNRIYKSILVDQVLEPVQMWFKENRSFLKKFNSNLEFEINYCQFLSLVQKGDINGAINYSKKNLSSYGNEENYSDTDHINYTGNLARLKEIGGLLVFLAVNMNSNTLQTLSGQMIQQMPRFHEYEKLLSDERWENLAKSFFKNFTDLNSVSNNYPLFVYLSAGLSSLKTKSCYKNEENTIFEAPRKTPDIPQDQTLLTDRKYRGPDYYYRILDKVNNCPTCSPELFELSKDLPFAQLITSIFNSPFKLPNGNIYPFEKLLNPSEKYLSEKNTLLRMGKVKDPLTREIFLVDHCVRVYPA